MKKYLKLIIIIDLVFLVFCSLVLGYRYVGLTPAIKEAIAMATTQMPETFTELYFEDHLNLPNLIEPKKEYKFTFTIHNLENKDMEYPYEIYLLQNEEKTIIYQDKVSIKNNEYQSIDKTIAPLENIRTKVVVELVDKNQIISFWLEKK